MFWTRELASSLGAVTLAIGLVSSSACADESKPSSTRAAAEPRGDQADPLGEAQAQAQDQSEDEGDSDSESEALAEVLELEVAVPEAKVGANVLTSQGVSPAPVTPTWTEIASLDEPVDLRYVAAGVIGRAGEVYVERDKSGALVQRPDLEIPAGELIGYWPKDAYLVQRELSEGGEPRLRVLAFNGVNKWKALAYEGKLRFVDHGQEFQKGWRAGLLVRDGASLERLGSTRSISRLGPRMGREVLEVIESASGELYHLSRRPTGVHAQQQCGTRSCVEERSKKLPYGTQWRFGLQVPRLRNSLSLVASFEVDDTVAHHLLHYETGGWKLEALVFEPKGLWPARDGGLWVLVGGKLLHRDRQGAWFEVALPEGAGDFSVAVTPKLDELWLAASVGGREVVYSTPTTLADDDAAP
ncbi:hypothetical protein G6O69_03450 [Pseudenhygromyxa sp. WMMC2535]|uniref:hypothetical protein n=1 Tax=Pseudenhygromyxa sp. WMMC2535 TaxID=2712867 RepID=UPI0015576762|nr:hypothetical protein [Pseudenhygromyxa sp. WMMC2535]NVB36870.1 hypothetical protein [Pseudenhygromyxa sp. WMMC2535]